jgi:hypothetical protein
MTDEEIIQAAKQVEGLRGMTVNERLWNSGLMDEFDRVKWKNKVKARKILQALEVDDQSIAKILNPFSVLCRFLLTWK